MSEELQEIYQMLGVETQQEALDTIADLIANKSSLQAAPIPTIHLNKSKTEIVEFLESVANNNALRFLSKESISTIYLEPASLIKIRPLSQETETENI